MGCELLELPPHLAVWWTLSFASSSALSSACKQNVSFAGSRRNFFHCRNGLQCFLKKNLFYPAASLNPTFAVPYVLLWLTVAITKNKLNSFLQSAITGVWACYRDVTLPVCCHVPPLFIYLCTSSLSWHHSQRSSASVHEESFGSIAKGMFSITVAFASVFCSSWAQRREEKGLRGAVSHNCCGDNILSCFWRVPRAWPWDMVVAVPDGRGVEAGHRELQREDFP